MSNKKKCKSYKCVRCNHIFYNKTYFVKHLKRKFKCSIINENIDFEVITTDILLDKLENGLYDSYFKSITSKKYKCKFCNKFYTNSQNALRHSKTCLNNPVVLKKSNITIPQINGAQTNITNNNITVNQQQNIIINNFGKEDLSLVEFNKMLFIKNEKQFWENKKYISNMHHNINLMLKGIYNKPENINFTNNEENEKHYYLLEDKDTLYDKDNFFEIILNNSFQHFKNYLYKNKLEYTFEHYITYLNSHFLKYNINNWQSNNKIKSIFYNFISEKT